MKKNEILAAFEKEYKRAKKKFPVWPDHIAAKAGIVVEEAGELMQASLQYKYERKRKPDLLAEQVANIKAEAVQVMVTAFRFLENFDK